MPATIERINHILDLRNYWKELAREDLAAKSLSKVSRALKQIRYYEKLLKKLGKQLRKEQKMLAKLGREAT